jgi:AcrR family transcriptional regulator
MATRGPSTPGPGEGNDARQRILDTAETEFARQGFDATPTARIATLAGVPKGLLFYYFPTKIDLLRAVLAERLPVAPLCSLAGIARSGDIPGSLVRLNRRLNLGEHASPVLRTIVFREAETHPEVGEHIRALRAGVVDLTDRVLRSAAPVDLDDRRRRQAAETFVALMFDAANSRRADGPSLDLKAAAGLIAAGLLAGPAA